MRIPRRTTFNRRRNQKGPAYISTGLRSDSEAAQKVAALRRIAGRDFRLLDNFIGIVKERARKNAKLESDILPMFNSYLNDPIDREVTTQFIAAIKVGGVKPMAELFGLAGRLYIPYFLRGKNSGKNLGNLLRRVGPEVISTLSRRLRSGETFCRMLELIEPAGFQKLLEKAYHNSHRTSITILQMGKSVGAGRRSSLGEELYEIENVQPHLRAATRVANLLNVGYLDACVATKRIGAENMGIILSKAGGGSVGEFIRELGVENFVVLHKELGAEKFGEAFHRYTVSGFEKLLTRKTVKV